MTRTAEKTLEIITNSLAGGYQQLVVGTFQEASEIMNGRRLEPDRETRQKLRNRFFYTANLFLARKEGGRLEYGLSGREAFDGIAGQDIGEFSRQLIGTPSTGTGFYKLTPEQIGALPSFVDIVWVDQSELNLQSDPGNRWSFVGVDTSDYFAERSNDGQRGVAQKIYGSMERKREHVREYTDFGENMNMLHGAGKTTASIHFPTPSYVQEFIKEGEVVARASCLCPFVSDSKFYANMVDVDHPSWGLRGVRNVVAESDALAPKVEPRQVNPIENAYNTLLIVNPDQALRAMTQDIVTRLSELVTLYLRNQGR